MIAAHVHLVFPFDTYISFDSKTNTLPILQISTSRLKDKNRFTQGHTTNCRGSSKAHAFSLHIIVFLIAFN